MGLKIRLRKQGRKNSPFYRLVLVESLSKRDGQYIEMLGWYNPVLENSEDSLSIKADRVEYWLDNGAELSDNARSLVKRGAPDVIRRNTEKAVAKKTKMAAKRRARRKAVAA
ncbi:MAG: 30S ribosomal protein S16 [Chlamydiota bacterium]|nr:30S ribosomal protein S16 [Chlamydiota bacterium]